MGEARATSDDLTLTSDTIDLRVADDLLQRAVAWGPSRARANSPTQELLADSIDVSMPAQRVREIYAVRGAAAHGEPDSTRFRADTVDWLRGDTIIASFDSTVIDTTRLRELHAIGNARSYYHLAPADTSLDRPAINYVTGREIIVDFREQRVTSVNVVEQASGVYLEPTPLGARDSTRIAPGGSPVRPDSAAVRPASTRPTPAAARPTPPPSTRPPVRRP
jgi:hypothetical protein